MEPDFLPLCTRFWLRKTNDVDGLHIDSEYANCRPHFTKLEQGSKVAVTLQAFIQVSFVLKLLLCNLIGQHKFDHGHQTVFFEWRAHDSLGTRLYFRTIESEAFPEPVVTIMWKPHAIMTV